MGRTACTEPQYLYKGALYLYLTFTLTVYKRLRLRRKEINIFEAQKSEGSETQQS